MRAGSKRVAMHQVARDFPAGSARGERHEHAREDGRIDHPLRLDLAEDAAHGCDTGRTPRAIAASSGASSRRQACAHDDGAVVRGERRAAGPEGVADLDLERGRVLDVVGHVVADRRPHGERVATGGERQIGDLAHQLARGRQLREIGVHQTRVGDEDAAAERVTDQHREPHVLERRSRPAAA